MAKKFDIFISYRRKGGFDTAKHLYDRLTLEGYSVSFDIDTLRSGDFDQALIQRIDECKDFILILNKEIFDRCLDPNNDPKQDWVRTEIVRALEKKKNIIPFALDGFVFPPDLPPDIAGLAKKNALEHSQKNFEGIYSKLVNTFLLSKPKWSVRYKNPIIAFMVLFVIAIVGYLTATIMQSKEDADAAIQAERANAAAQADLLKRATDSLRRATDSINKAAADRAAALADSIKKEMDKKPAAPPPQAARGGSGSAPKSKTLYWSSSGEEGSVMFNKLSGAGLKIGKCQEPGLKVSLSKAACKPNSMGVIKCTFTPALTISDCNGTMQSILTYSQTFSGSNKVEAVSRQKLFENLEAASFSDWVSQLRAMR